MDIFPLLRFLYRTFQGTLFPTQLQLGRQLSRLPPEVRSQCLERWNTKKDTDPHKYPGAHYSLENPYFIANESLNACNQNNPTELSDCRNEKTQQPKTEITTGLSISPPLCGAQLSEENGCASVGDSEGISSSSQKITHITSELGPTMTEETFQWNSAVDQSDFSLLNWITSTPLFKGSGRDSPWSSSSLQNVRQDNTVPCSCSSPQDFKVLPEKNTICFQEQIQRSAKETVLIPESFESTFLWHRTLAFCFICTQKEYNGIALIISRDETGNPRYIMLF